MYINTCDDGDDDDDGDDGVLQLLKELSNVEEALTDQKSSLVGNYTTSLCLCIVGVFRKYHAYLLVSPELTVVAFEG